MGADRKTPGGLECPLCALDHALVVGPLGQPDGVGDAVRGRSAVGDHGDAAQPQEDRAADRVRVDLVAQTADPPADQQAADARDRRRGDRLADRADDVFEVPSIAFRATLPVKPSVTTTSSSPPVRSLPSTLPTKLSCVSAAASRSCAATTSGVPLPGLLAVREQADLRALDAVDGLHEGGAHVGELDQVLGADLVVGAGVEQQDRAARDRQQRGDRGRWTPRMRLMCRPMRPARRRSSPRTRGPSASPAATARAARTIEAFSLERTARTGSSSLPIASGASATSSPASSGAGGPVHAHGHARPAGALGDHLEGRRRRRARRARSRPDLGPRAARSPDGPASGRGRRQARRDDLAALVVAADRADPVRQARRLAVRAVREARRVDLVLRAALVRARVRLSLLGDGHGDGGV